MHPDVTLPRARTTSRSAVSRGAEAAAIKRSEISTLVLNGTTIAGLARDTSYKLAVAGFHTVSCRRRRCQRAAGPRPTLELRLLRFRAGEREGGRAAAQAAIGAHTIVAPLPPRSRRSRNRPANPLTVVVVGTAFSGEIVNPPAHSSRRRRAAAERAATTPARRSAGAADRAKVPFPSGPAPCSSAPRSLDRSSRSALQAVPHKHELVPTYVTGAGNVYWDVIETELEDAPILRRPDRVYKVAGRKFDLFTTGGHIHMVVLYNGGTSYWVVNTLRDELSNETMLAIAKGLPLGR